MHCGFSIGIHLRNLGFYGIHETFYSVPPPPLLLKSIDGQYGSPFGFRKKKKLKKLSIRLSFWHGPMKPPMIDDHSAEYYTSLKEMKQLLFELNRRGRQFPSEMRYDA